MGKRKNEQPADFDAGIDAIGMEEAPAREPFKQRAVNLLLLVGGPRVLCKDAKITALDELTGLAEITTSDGVELSRVPSAAKVEVGVFPRWCEIDEVTTPSPIPTV